MATVLTRLLPSTSGRLLTRQLRKDPAAVNKAAHRTNSTIAAHVETEDNTSEASASVEDDVAANVDEVINDGEEDSDYRSAEEERAEEAVSPGTEITRVLRGGYQRRQQRRVSTRHKRRRVDDEEEEVEEQDDDDDADSSGSSEGASTAGTAWDEASDAAEEVEVEIANPNRCIFCGQDEEHDPGEEFEEILSCSICGDNAHRQCARDEDSLPSEDVQKWHCPSCIENGVVSDEEEPSSPPARRRSSVPKMSRDLLPAGGPLKPGAHSIYSTLILDDDPLDGSRALRKRRISSESQAESRHHEPRKRQRRSTSALEPVKVEDAVAVPSPATPQSTEETTQAAESEQARRTRPPRRQVSCKVALSDGERLVLCFSLGLTKYREFEHEMKKRRRRERDRARRARQAEVVATIPEVVTPHYPAISTNMGVIAPFYGSNDRDGDESKTKPYGGILSESEADTSRTFPQAADRKKFEDARQKAEEAWRKKIEATSVNGVARPLPKVSGPPSKIKCINFGKHEIDTWHAAPYPEEYSRNRVLYICEFCLKYMSSDYVAWRHKLKCPTKHPPGDEIYRDGNFSFFEVDGRKNPVYCQNLCLLAKLFLGSKTLYYDVEPFLFYVMTEHDQFGEHFVGYFSKEKRPSSLNNVSCILVLPIHQRRGFGHMLIEFSYLLTKVEKKTGSPEKPLSDMGLVSYRSYWRLLLCRELLDQKKGLSILDLSERTGMTADDVVSALEGLRALVRDPVTRTYALRLDYNYFQQYIDNYEKKGYPRIMPDALCWVPYVMGRDNMHYEGIPHIHTVAQRDDTLVDVDAEEGVQMEVEAEKQDNDVGTDEQCQIAAAAAISAPESATDDKGSEEMLTPFPTLDVDAKLSTPLKASTSDPGSATDKPMATPIPPTRFEVFPPLPGTIAKRRPGRPFGRRGSRRGTPSRLGNSPSRAFAESPQVSFGSEPATIRRTRSGLADSVVNGASDEEDENNEENAADPKDDVTAEPDEAEEAEMQDDDSPPADGGDQDESMDEA